MNSSKKEGEKEAANKNGDERAEGSGGVNSKGDTANDDEVHSL